MALFETWCLYTGMNLEKNEEYDEKKNERYGKILKRYQENTAGYGYRTCCLRIMVHIGNVP